MNRRLMTILISAFLIAAGASYVVYGLVRKQIGGNTKHVTVVIAVRDLQIGAIVKPADLAIGAFAGNPPKDVIVKPESAVGRGVTTPIYAGEPVNEKRLAPAGSGGGLAATIPPGMRACAVKVNDVVGLAGFVLPGMRVDVLVLGNYSGERNPAGARVRTILQNIQVLSAGKNLQRDDEGKPIEVQVVNLLVTPEQAELLSLANNNAQIQLVLRNPLDQAMAKSPGSQVASLFGGPEAPAAPAALRNPAPAAARIPAPKTAEPPPKPETPPPYVVHVMNGSKQTEEKFALEEGESR